MHKIYFVLFALFLSSAVLADDKPAQVAVATAHPIATAAGLEILNAGGNAFDAAVAVSATLAVVEPYSSGIGGGGFWLLHRARDGRQVMVDGRERAPLAAHRDMYLDTAGEVIPAASVSGPLSAGIPGEPAALVHLAKNYGRLPLHKTLAPAIRAAKKGFKVTPYYRRMVKFRLKALRESPAAAKIFLKDNEVPPLAHLIRQPDLARTLELLAQNGTAGFYAGEVARRLVKGTRDAGGIWSLNDLKQYTIRERQPLVGQYKGYRIVSAAPPSSGGVALLEILNILNGVELAGMTAVQKKHHLVEAMRRAYRDRAEYLGDPDFVNIPLQRLLSQAYARQLRDSINQSRATPSASLKPVVNKEGGFHTSHFSILDKEGNRVAATLTINYPFGSCFMPPGTGVLLNDEMDDFSAKPGVPNVYGLVGAKANAIAPGKRMLSSMSPSFVEGKDRLIILGTPGGSRIITMVLQGMLAFIDGKDVASIVDQARFHHQYLPDEIQYEEGAITKDELSKMMNMGHSFKRLDHPYGNMHAVVWDKKKNKVSAASDYRGEGFARVQ